MLGEKGGGGITFNLVHQGRPQRRKGICHARRPSTAAAPARSGSSPTSRRRGMSGSCGNCSAAALAAVALASVFLPAAVQSAPPPQLRQRQQQLSATDQLRQLKSDGMLGGGDKRKSYFYDDDMRSYLDKLERMEYEDLVDNLAALAQPLSSSDAAERIDSIDRQMKLLERIKEYEEVKDAVNAFAPFISALTEDDDDDGVEWTEGHEDASEEEKDDEFPEKLFSKRVEETIDREDDWLLPGDDREFLSSRRRIYPNKFVDYDDEEEEEDEDLPDKGQVEEEQNIQNFQMSKKDLESLVDQADPSLTVKGLSPEPQISFRKGVEKAARQEQEKKRRRKKKKKSLVLSARKAVPDEKEEEKAEAKTEKPIRVSGRGMPEVAMSIPASARLSPLQQWAEEQELARLNAG